MKTENNIQERSAGRIIDELSRAAHVYFHSEFQNHSIGHAQIKTLLHISRNEGLSQLDLSETLRLDKSSVTSQLQILEKNGFIIRQPSKKDGRKHCIMLTNKTHELLEPLKQVFSSWTTTLLKGFNDVEKEELFLYLERMQHNAREKLELIKTKK